MLGQTMKVLMTVVALLTGFASATCYAQSDGQEHAIRWLSSDSWETVNAKIVKIIEIKSTQKSDQYRIEYLRTGAPSKDKAGLQYLYRVKESDGKFELTIKVRQANTATGTLSIDSGNEIHKSLQAQKIISKDPKSKIETDVTWSTSATPTSALSVSHEIKLSEAELKASMNSLALTKGACSAAVSRLRFETKTGQVVTLEAWKLPNSAVTMYEISEKGKDETQLKKRFSSLVKQVSSLGFKPEGISKTEYVMSCKT
jgi:hypothetical protein